MSWGIISHLSWVILLYYFTALTKIPPPGSNKAAREKDAGFSFKGAKYFKK
jgi:hypothetical protein